MIDMSDGERYISPLHCRPHPERAYDIWGADLSKIKTALNDIMRANGIEDAHMRQDRLSECVISIRNIINDAIIDGNYTTYMDRVVKKIALVKDHCGDKVIVGVYDSETEALDAIDASFDYIYRDAPSTREPNMTEMFEGMRKHFKTGFTTCEVNVIMYGDNNGYEVVGLDEGPATAPTPATDNKKKQKKAKE